MGAPAPLAALASDLVPPRLWLERLALLVPGNAATRWLLLADAGCLVAMGGATRWPLLGIPAALGSGFIALNLMGIAVTDFYLGLALFHLAVGVTAAAVLHRARWAGASLVVLALALGILT
jgi:hypothetical protein